MISSTYGIRGAFGIFECNANHVTQNSEGEEEETGREREEERDRERTRATARAHQVKGINIELVIYLFLKILIPSSLLRCYDNNLSFHGTGLTGTRVN